MSPLPLLTSPRGQAALSYLPSLYERSRVMQTILQAEGLELDDLRKAIDGILDQFFARTATWSLDRWETELGLPPASTQADSERRDRIVSRIRGFGTCTVAIVKAVAESYDMGAIEVTEQTPLYQVTVTFIDTRGVPPNLDDLKRAVEAVIPAHLSPVYEFNWTTWDNWDDQNLTWDQVDALGLTWDQHEVYL